MGIDNESLGFLKELIEAISPSGFEEDAVKVWRERTGKFCSQVTIDTTGNAIAKLENKGPKVMLAGHIDEIGLMVKYIDKEGFIYFSPIGGIDPYILQGQRVWLRGKKGKVLGVIGKKPIHLIEEEEKNKRLKFEEMWIDVGLDSEDKVKEIIDIGTVGVVGVGFEKLGEVAVGRGFDDKAGAFVVSEVMKILSGHRPAATVYGVATVQEEVGLRGARVSSYGITPDYALAIDVTFTSDTPSLDKRKIGKIDLGKGPVLAWGPNINKELFGLLKQTAEEDNIPYQIEAIPRPTGTDANVMQMTKSGVATALVSIPNRYMHTPVEIISLEDLVNAAQLISKFIYKLS